MNATAFITIGGQRHIDTNLLKMGYNRRTKFFHRIKFNGGFYTAFCETGTRIDHFEELEEAKMSRLPCKKCFPKGEPPRRNWEWSGPWIMVNVSRHDPIEGQWYVARLRTGAKAAQFGPFTEATATELLEFLTCPEEE